MLAVLIVLWVLFAVMLAVVVVLIVNEIETHADYVREMGERNE